MIHNKSKFRLVGVIIVLAASLFIIGCGQSSQVGGAASAVESYLKALVSNDLNQLINASCVAWEESARQELRTFDAVEVTLQDLSCLAGEQAGSSSVVSCSGKIVANYGNEVLEINLADRQYQAVDEGGEWRMCGYR